MFLQNGHFMKILLLLSTGIEECSAEILHHFVPLSHESFLKKQD